MSSVFLIQPVTRHFFVEIGIVLAYLPVPGPCFFQPRKQRRAACGNGGEIGMRLRCGWSRVPLRSFLYKLRAEGIPFRIVSLWKKRFRSIPPSDRPRKKLVRGSRKE